MKLQLYEEPVKGHFTSTIEREKSPTSSRIRIHNFTNLCSKSVCSSSVSQLLQFFSKLQSLSKKQKEKTSLKKIFLIRDYVFKSASLHFVIHLRLESNQACPNREWRMKWKKRNVWMCVCYVMHVRECVCVSVWVGGVYVRVCVCAWWLANVNECKKLVYEACVC